MKIHRIDAERFHQYSESGAVSLIADPDYDMFWLISSPSLEQDIVVAHADYHLDPEASVVCHGCAVGANEWLFYVHRGALTWKHQLPSRFFSFVRAFDSELLIHHEIGFTKIGCDGRVRLSAITGLLSIYTLDGDMLRYETFEGEKGALRV
jgi:hypothetical protein